MMRSESIGTLRACIVVCFTIGFATISHADDAVAGKPKLATNPFVEDFNYAWQEIGSTFAYFDARATVWSDIPRLYKRDLQQVKTREQFVGLMEQVLDELYDPHTQLTTNTPKSFRLVPSGTDLWAEWHGGVATITQVRGESDAERVGIKPATTVLSINGVAIAAAVEARLGRSYPHQT